MDLRIENKAVIVTGGSTGVGKAIAQELALNGARVLITARNKDRLEETANFIREHTGADIVAVPSDVSKPETPARLVKEALTQVGGVDILVNNAGRAHPGGLMDTTDEDWNDMIGTKINALVRLCRAAIPHMRAAGWGRIVNISSIGGIHSNPKLLISHTLSAAINNFTKGLALEVAADGILVNAIGLGAIATPNWTNNMVPLVRATRDDLADLSEEELMKRLGKEKTPVGQFGQPEDIADIAAFMASDRNRFVTGSTIEASGGADRFI
jgi:3-oxoacyl-[acyl-carrier protein] reductase